ncbi:MAG: hypothetical protein JRI23_36395 [Deltaproteobacteria bacterium]|nr:hypothetical protein [Deltaproteobacteria bacterium]
MLESAAGDEPIFERVDDLFDRAKLEAAVRRKVRSVRGRIAVLWQELPSDARGVILQIAREENVSRKRVGAEWLVQRMLFLEIGRRFELDRVERFARSSPDCFLVLTQRSSLITGDAVQARGERVIEYIRIPSRAKSWDKAVSFTGRIKTLRCGHRAKLPGLRTSPVQFILTIPASRAVELRRITHLTTTGLGSTFVDA